MTPLKTLFVLFTFAAITFPNAVTAQVYRVEDDQGEVTYTDSPAEGSRAESVELPPINTQPGLAPPPKAPPTTTEPGQSYTTAYILQPENDSTIPPGSSTWWYRLHWNRRCKPDICCSCILMVRHMGNPWRVRRFPSAT